jgi:hypothetical protein
LDPNKIPTNIFGTSPHENIFHSSENHVVSINITLGISVDAMYSNFTSLETCLVNMETHEKVYSHLFDVNTSLVYNIITITGTALLNNDSNTYFIGLGATFEDITVRINHAHVRIIKIH